MINLIKKIFPKRFGVASLTRIHPLGLLTERLMFEGDELYYLPQEKEILSAERTIEVREEVTDASSFVLPSRIAEHFVERSSFRFIMDFCICREAEGCSDFPRDLGCLFMGEGARGINRRLGRAVSKDEALAHVRRAMEAGLVQLVGRNKLDTLWLGTGPGNRLMTMCFCCPCCCLWKIAPLLPRSISAKLHRVPGVAIKTSERCTGCGKCLSLCIFRAIRIVGGKAVIGEECRGCGLCVNACPRGAVRLELPDEGSIRQVIESLTRAVDVS